MEGVDEIKKEAKDYFKAKFMDQEHSRPKLAGIEFNRLSIEDKYGLEVEFSKEEIKEVAFSCEGDTSIGPGGFNL